MKRRDEAEVEWYQDDDIHPCMMENCVCPALQGEGNAFCPECYTMWAYNDYRLDFSLEEIVLWHFE